MKQTKTFCDLCGTEHHNHYENFKLIHCWGRVALFIGAPSAHLEQSYDDCCPSCSQQIKEGIEVAIAKIRSPLNGELK